MPEFLTLKPPGEALAILNHNLEFNPQSENIRTEDSLGRVLFSSVRAEIPIPGFRRSTVDGFAVRAGDTYGASESLPAYLPLVGEVPMGAAPDFVLEAGTCAVIHTGGMLPQGADAVMMIEYTQQASEKEVELLRAVAVGENVLEIGEDVQQGEQVIPAGTLIRPAEIGGLMALGITEVEVARKPLVGILSSGDEVIHPSEDLSPGKVRDINSYTLQALVRQAGGLPQLFGVAPDTHRDLAELFAKAHQTCDLVVVTAGSSASVRDLTAIVIDELGEPGVLVHGVNVRPGKPTILGVCDGKPVIGLPGNPVSALVIAGLFVTPTIKRMLGRQERQDIPVIEAVLAVNLSSQSGREEWVAVSLEGGEDGLVASPVFGKSNLIFTLVRGEGLVHIPADATGLAAGSRVKVYLI
ncbi:MAG: molybdopterin molybdenumtransferase MoeA [Anaerolineales bacterium]|nr:molybdopterin molybdenumtransferase MoeA [Anaerolineales bacterium]